MAQSLRRPVLQTIRLLQPCEVRSPWLSTPSYLPPTKPPQRRQFTQTPPRWVGAFSQQPQAVRPRQKGEQSLQVLQKAEMARGVPPSDIGILEQTLIPPRTRYSELFRTPRGFLRFQYTKMRYYLGNHMSLIVLKLSSPQGGKRWYNKSYKLARSSVIPAAQKLHVDMYAAFAAGDLRSLKSICMQGLLQSFAGRIRRRPKEETIKWELLKYVGRPKVVSDRAAVIPGMEGAAIRQAVVRIRSLQRLTKEVEDQKVEGTGEEVQVEEYVVVQQNLENWQPGEWKVWGTTKTTSLDDVKEWEKKKAES